MAAVPVSPESGKQSAPVDNSDVHPGSNPTPQRARVPISCSKAFDSLYFCYSPFYQGKIYYQTGQLDDCRGRLKRFRMCAMSRLRPEAESEKLYEQEELVEQKESAPPVWNLRSAYLERMKAVDEEEREKRRNDSEQTGDGWWL